MDKWTSLLAIAVILVGVAFGIAKDLNLGNGTFILVAAGVVYLATLGTLLYEAIMIKEMKQVFRTKKVILLLSHFVLVPYCIWITALMLSITDA